MENSVEGGKRSLPVNFSEHLFAEDTNREIESFPGQELLREKSFSQYDELETQHANEQMCGTEDANHGNITNEEVNSLLTEKNCMQNETERSGKRNDTTERSHENILQIDNANEKIQYDIGITVENVGERSFEGMEVPDVLSEGKTGERENPSVEHTKVKELVTEAKPLKISSSKTTALSPLWSNYILSVRGIPPREAGRLKKRLGGVFGDNCYRIRPTQKGATVVYLHFLRLQDMKIARECLHNQSIANYKLTVTVDRASGLKQKFIGSYGLPAVKKMRKQKRLLQFYEKSYEEQIELKMADIRTKLQDLSKYICKKSPTFSSFIRQKQLEHGGAICALGTFKDCFPSERAVSVFVFAVGSDKETGQLVVGISEGDGHVRKLSSAKQNYPDHVVKITEVFEEFVHTQGNQKIWDKLLIHTNSMQDLMLLVFLDCTNDKLKQVCEDMKIFFTSGEGMKYNIASVYIRDMNNHDIKETALDLVMGAPCLEDTIAGLRLQLPPTRQLWNSVHGAETLCKVTEELLAPSKKMTVLEIGCGNGLIGLYLSKVAGEVLSVDTKSAVEIAEKNASLNGITNCRYFAGKGEDVIPVLVKEQKYDEVCAVVMFSKNRSYKIVTALEQLRKVQRLNRLVLVEDKAFTFNTIQVLSEPSSEKGMGNPFFPLKAVPVDCPNSKGYLLLILLERICHDDVERFGINDKPVPRMSELNTKASASKKQGDWHLLPGSVWERTVFLQQSGDMGPGITARALDNSLFQNTASSIQLQTAEKIQRAYFGASSSLAHVTDKYYLRDTLIEKQRRLVEEEEQRRQMAEVQVRQIQEEEWNRWMLKRRMQVEEKWIRQFQEGEQWGRIQEEQRIREADWMRCLQEDERRRRIQEEEERQIQEEQRRQIEEEEWKRHIQEEERKAQEHRRRIQEEEWRRQIQENEQKRRAQEEEWRKRMLEEDKRRIQEEEEQRRQILGERQKREMLTEERKRRIQEEWMRQTRGEYYREPVLEETYRRQMEEERERELMRMSLNLRSRNDMMNNLMADSRNRAAVPQFSADEAQKMKHMLAEVMRNARMVNQGERRDVSIGRGAGGVHPEDNTVSEFGRRDKEIQGTGAFEGGYSRQIRDINYREHGHDVYGGALKRRGFEQDDQKPQQYFLNRNQKTISETSLNLPSLLELKLKPPEISGASSRVVQHPVDKSFFLDARTNQRPGWVLTAQREMDIHVKHDQQADRFTSQAVQDVNSARRNENSNEFSSHAKLDRLATRGGMSKELNIHAAYDQLGNRPSSHATQDVYSARRDKSAFSVAGEQHAEVFRDVIWTERF